MYDSQLYAAFVKNQEPEIDAIRERLVGLVRNDLSGVSRAFTRTNFFVRLNGADQDNAQRAAEILKELGAKDVTGPGQDPRNLEFVRY